MSDEEKLEIPCLYLLDPYSGSSDSGFTKLIIKRVIYDSYLIHKGEYYLMGADFYKIVDMVMDDLRTYDEYIKKDRYELCDIAIKLVEKWDWKEAKIIIMQSVRAE